LTPWSTEKVIGVYPVATSPALLASSVYTPGIAVPFEKTASTSIADPDGGEDELLEEVVLDVLELLLVLELLVVEELVVVEVVELEPVDVLVLLVVEVCEELVVG